jgi:hypothetical protein
MMRKRIRESIAAAVVWVLKPQTFRAAVIVSVVWAIFLTSEFGLNLLTRLYDWARMVQYASPQYQARKQARMREVLVFLDEAETLFEARS